MPPRHNPRPHNPHRAVQPMVVEPPLNLAESTIPSPSVQVKPVRVAPPNQVQQIATSKSLPIRSTPKPKRRAWWLIPLIGILGFFGVALAVVMLAALTLYSGGILPNVRAMGVELGGLSVAEAAAVLRDQWTTVTLTDTATDEVWQIDPQQIGLTLDTDAMASLAYEQGRTDGSALIVVRGVDIAPIVSLDLEAARAGLDTLRPDLETPALDAGIEVVNGEVRAKPPQSGRLLDLDATLAQLRESTVVSFANTGFEIVRVTTQPQVMDAALLVEAARQLLSQSLNIRVFDPVTGDSITWDAAPETWITWLTATPNPDSPIGLALTVNHAQVGAYLDANAAVLDSSRYLDNDKAIAEIERAVQRGDLQAMLRVYHHDRQHLVQAGETIISIAWDYGVPYPWIQQANPGVDALAVGQTLTIPSQDNFFQFDPVPEKRIVVSISQQRTWVYENGALKWEWGASTGISSSPTWPGVYQIISHEPNAYASNWDLWMPNFMGVYQPIPGQDFTNGFHGFPTRGGGQLLWENSIGTKVTYGCILLSNANVQQLYDWAPNGVVVEIQP